MTKPATAVRLTADEERTLRRWITQAAHQQLKADRAKVILLAAENMSTQHIAGALRKTAAQVSKWRTRYAAYGIAGLEDAEKAGRPTRYGATTDAQILALVEQIPPESHAAWTGSLIARTLGNVSVDYVWRVLRSRGISLRRADQKQYDTTSTVVLRLVSTVGLYLSRDASAFLVGEAENSTSAGCRLGGYVRVPSSAVAAELKCTSLGSDRLPLLEALQGAVSLAGAGRYAGARLHKINDFLEDALRRSAAREIHAFIFGPHTPCSSHLYTHNVPTLREWKVQLESWLAVFLSGTPDENVELIPRLLAAIQDFVTLHPGGQTAAFEWHARLEPGR